MRSRWPVTQLKDLRTKMARADLMQELKQLYAQDPDHLPVVPLDLYFDGNDQEDSIAPNQWEYGRPPISQIYDRFKQIDARPNVEGVFVGMHHEWGDALEDDSQWPLAENIHILTNASIDDVEHWLEGLASDGASVGWPYGKHAGAPEPSEGYAVITVFWD